MFLREYIDKLFEETSKVAKKRVRVYNNDHFALDEKVPSNAPRWSLAGYNGSMKTAVEEACRRRTNSSTNLSVMAIDDNDQERIDDN